MPSARFRSMNHVLSSPALSSAAAATLLVVVLAAGQVSRPGFSADEEITALTVQGISEAGAPVLPSGALYLRGLLYSYAAWMSGAALGHDLPAYRLASLTFGIIAVVVMVGVARSMTTPMAVICAPLLLATYQPFAAAASFARFYSAFVAAALAVVWLLPRSETDSRHHWRFLVGLAMCRLVHEFAMVLALLPLCHAVCAPAGKRRQQLLTLFLKSLVLMAFLQLGMSAAENASLRDHAGAPMLRIGAFGAATFASPPWPLQALASPRALALILAALISIAIPAARVTRVSWITLSSLVLCAFAFQLGALGLVVLVAVVSQPRLAARTVLAGLVMASASIALWMVVMASASDALISPRLVWQLSTSTFWYPWEAFVHAGRTHPLLIVTAAYALLELTFTPSVDLERDGIRPLALFAICAYAALGIVGVDLQWRYMLLASPFLVLLSAHGVSVVGHRVGLVLSAILPVRPHRSLARIAATILIVLVTGEQYRSLVQASDSATLSAPTDARWEADVFRAYVQPDDVIVSNDELACRFLVGRVDYWLVTSARILDRYTAGNAGDRRGFYAGAKVVSSEAEIDRLVKCGGRSVVFVVLDTGKFDFDETRALADRMAAKFGGATWSAGGEHVIVRIPRTASLRDCL